MHAEGKTGNGEIRAVLWDFGGVITSSPFEAFNCYEATHGLPRDFLRSVNTHNPDTNAWARLERSEIDAQAFSSAFEAESKALGHAVPGADLLELLSGKVREDMVSALARIGRRYQTACLTNNVRAGRGPGMARSPQRAARIGEVMKMFDLVIQSSQIGVRKPEPRFYAIALDQLGVGAHEVVYLDDLGINLKPARAMGMRTIKVTDPQRALEELEAVLGHPVRET